MADGFLDVKDFILEPFTPAIGGDSGALYIASQKTDPSIRYVVKSTTPELACNEFAYQKIAAALGLHTQEVKLFQPNKRFRYGAAIRYAENAREATAEDFSVGAPHFADLIAFQTLYVILNEEDSQEYFIDEAGRFFKLDNAASFNLGPYNISMINSLPEDDAIALMRKSLDFTEYSKYSMLLRLTTEHYGDAGRAACLSMFERFAALDEAKFDTAFDDLSKVYSCLISEYYYAFVESRKELCGRLLKEAGSRQ